MAKKKTKKAEAGKKAKARFAIDTDSDLVEEVRDMVVFLQRKGDSGGPYTMAGVGESFIRDGLAKLKRKHKLTKVPPRNGALRQGRPIK